MNGAQFLIQALLDEGVDLIFGYPGGAIMPAYDALLNTKLRHILVRHEQAAALAADGYARATGRVGVCMATSGPGATNLLTGIANAYLDSIPMVAITGQVPTPFLGTDAFQEVDVLGMSFPIVKHSYLVRKPEDLARIIPEAFDLAVSGRPGPVMIDIPKDVLQAEVPVHEVPNRCAAPLQHPEEQALKRAQALLAKASKPVLYVGGGVILGRAVDQLRTFAEVCGIPAVTTLKGIGALPVEAPLNLGMLGMHGHKAANLAVQQSDLLVVAGARFDDRATGKLDTFAPHAEVIHIDIDAAEISKLRAASVSLCCDLAPALKALARPLAIEDWRETCADLKQRFRSRYDAPGNGIYAPALLRRLSEKSPQAILSCDVGQHQMWVAQHCLFHRPEQHLSSGGLGTMGFGLPAAIGAILGCPAKTVVAVTGDGSFMMNVQELATLKRYNLPVKILVLDNQRLGLVRQWQTLFFAGRFSETDLSDNPSFTQLAGVFDIQGATISQPEQVEAALDTMLAVQGPYLLHVCIDPEENVWPLVPPGKSNAEMLEAVS